MEIISTFNKKIKDDRLKEYLQKLIQSLYSNFEEKYKSKHYSKFKDEDFLTTIYPDLEIKFQDVENVKTLISYLNTNFVRLYKQVLYEDTFK